MATIIIFALPAFALAILTMAARDDRKRQQQIADQHWRDVERQ